MLARLADSAPGLSFRIEPITTSGDVSGSRPRLGDGIFVKEIQRALLEDRIDLAVHSLKDVPTDPVEGLSIGAIPPRDDPREALVGSTLSLLPQGAAVGTSSPRRAAQLKRLRPDLNVKPLRGNVPTRVGRVAKGEYSAIMVAAAGLVRLGLPADEMFEPTEVLPAPGQGALAVEIRAEDTELATLVAAIHDNATRNAVTAERRVLRDLGGGCLLPVAAWGRVESGVLALDVAVTSADGKTQIKHHAEGPEESCFGIAKRAARELIRRGAREILEEEGKR